MKNHNQRGMSLIELAVAAGVGLVVVLGITSMLGDVFKSQRAAQSKDASREVVANIRSYLSDPKACQLSLQGGNPSGGGFTKNQIVDNSSNVKLQVGTSYFNLVTLTGLEVKNYVQDNASNAKAGKADLLIKMNKIGSSTGNAQMSSTVLLQVTLDAGGNVLQCHSLGGADSLWQISPNNKADVYFSGGNVGIGTANPAVAFDVAGGIKPGSVGVNKGGSCTVEGAMAYDSNAHTPVFCNSSLSWTTIGMSQAPTPIDCVGSWTCNITVSTYTILQQAANGGASCPYANGATKPCGWHCDCGPLNWPSYQGHISKDSGVDLTGQLCSSPRAQVGWKCVPR